MMTMGPSNGAGPASGPQTDETLAFLRDAYSHRVRQPGKTIDHPLAVGQLLMEAGLPQTVVLAGLLHDLLEDTTVSAGELRERFGAGRKEKVQG